jgi:hypothetical protein|tara:strand:- start:184 stop:849 length:666 start_codon:yes stop_codon:yes gene_type:complete
MYDNEVTITGVKLPIEELHLTYLIHKLRNEYGFLESSRNNVPVSGYKEIMPLYTYPCYEYLRSINWENSNIFEYGCGYSTVWWANMNTNIYGVEDNQEWVNKVNLNNKYKISVEKELEPYTKSIYKHKIDFDVIVIDGSFRTKCVEPALNCLAEGGIIVLDNCDNNPRAKELLDKSDLLPVHFHGFKPIHVDTETTSCYIHNKFSKKPKNIIPMGGTLRVK